MSGGSDFNKIITTVNSVTSDYTFIPDQNNLIVIDTSNNRIGINIVDPKHAIHVNGETILSHNIIIENDASFHNVADISSLIVRNDASFQSIVDISFLIVRNDASFQSIVDISSLIVRNDASFQSRVDISSLIVRNDASFQSRVDISSLIVRNSANIMDLSVTQISSDLIPLSDNNFSLGNTTNNWKELYIDNAGGIYFNDKKLIYYNANNKLELGSAGSAGSAGTDVIANGITMASAALSGNINMDQNDILDVSMISVDTISAGTINVLNGNLNMDQNNILDVSMISVDTISAGTINVLNGNLMMYQNDILDVSMISVDTISAGTIKHELGDEIEYYTERIRNGDVTSGEYDSSKQLLYYSANILNDYVHNMLANPRLWTTDYEVKLERLDDKNVKLNFKLKGYGRGGDGINTTMNFEATNIHLKGNLNMYQNDILDVSLLKVKNIDMLNPTNNDKGNITNVNRIYLWSLEGVNNEAVKMVSGINMENKDITNTKSITTTNLAGTTMTGTLDMSINNISNVKDITVKDKLYLENIENMNTNNTRGIVIRAHGFDSINFQTYIHIRQVRGSGAAFSDNAPDSFPESHNGLGGAQGFSGNRNYVIESDNRIKHNEQSILNGLNIIRQLKPLKYQKTQQLYDADYMGDLSNVPWLYESGFIAQDVLQINDLSWCVTGGDYIDYSNNLIESLHYLSYSDINIYHYAATKELDTQVQSFQTIITDLSSEVFTLKQENANLTSELTTIKQALNTLLSASGNDTI